MEDTQITYTLTRWDGGIARKIVTGWMRDFGLSFYCCFTDLKFLKPRRYLNSILITSLP